MGKLANTPMRVAVTSNQYTGVYSYNTAVNRQVCTVCTSQHTNVCNRHKAANMPMHAVVTKQSIHQCVK